MLNLGSTKYCDSVLKVFSKFYLGEFGLRSSYLGECGWISSSSNWTQCFGVPLLLCFGVLLLQCFGVPLLLCFGVPLLQYFGVPLLQCFGVPLLQCFGVPLLLLLQSSSVPLLCLGVLLLLLLFNLRPVSAKDFLKKYKNIEILKPFSPHNLPYFIISNIKKNWTILVNFFKNDLVFYIFHGPFYPWPRDKHIIKRPLNLRWKFSELVLVFLFLQAWDGIRGVKSITLNSKDYSHILDFQQFETFSFIKLAILLTRNGHNSLTLCAFMHIFLLCICISYIVYKKIE